MENLFFLFGIIPVDILKNQTEYILLCISSEMNGKGEHFLALCIKQYISHSVEQIYCIYDALNNTIHTVEQIQDLGQAGNELCNLSRSIGVRLSKLVSHSKIVKRFTL